MVRTATRCISVLSIAALLVTLLSSCVTRSFTKPRSELAEEARQSGVEVRTPEEDRQRFVAYDAAQRKELLRLIEERSGGVVRDPLYRLGVNDQVELAVFDVAELNVTVPVRSNGTITLPLIGSIVAKGRTEVELADEITDRLRTYVRNPQVSVAVTQYGSQLVGVIGAVRSPGSYPLKKGTNSVLELLSQAGGVNERAGAILTFVPAESAGVRPGSSPEEIRARLALASEFAAPSGGIASVSRGIEIPLDQVLGTSGMVPIEIPVQGGDMIIIPEAGRVMVEGEVNRVGTYELGNQMTLIGALAAAGGITYGAKIDEVEVIRELGQEGRAHLIVNLEELANGTSRDVRLRNGDIVRVPSDSGRRMTQDTFEAVTRVVNFGVGGSYNVR